MRDAQDYIQGRPRRNSGGSDGTGSGPAAVARTAAAPVTKPTDVKTKKIPKSERVMATLKKSLIGNPMFSDLDDLQIHEVCECMEGVFYKGGDAVFRIGHPGDFFYVVETGECEAYLTDAEDEAVAKYTGGEGFGELALLYNRPRAATIVATTDARLWRVDGNTFRAVVVQTTYKKRQYFESLLEKVPLLKALQEHERSKIADALEEVTFPANHIIIRQNDHGDYFYFCMEGTAKCTKTDRQGVEVDIMTIADTDYFGEIALLTDNPRRATITSTSTMKCARYAAHSRCFVAANNAQGAVSACRMHRRDFTRLLGPLQDILTFRKYEGASCASNPESATSDGRFCRPRLPLLSAGPILGILQVGARRRVRLTQPLLLRPAPCALPPAKRSSSRTRLAGRRG